MNIVYIVKKAILYIDIQDMVAENVDRTQHLPHTAYTQKITNPPLPFFLLLAPLLQFSSLLLLQRDRESPYKYYKSELLLSIE